MRSTYQPRSRTDGKSPFLLPATLMLSAILTAFWALRPQATVTTYASQESEISIEATQGEFQFELQKNSDSSPSLKISSPSLKMDETLLIANGDDGTYTATIPQKGGTIIISGNGVTGLTFLEGADEVTSVNGAFSDLKMVNVSKCPNLNTLDLENTELESIDLTNSKALTTLKLNTNGLSFDKISNYKGCTGITSDSLSTIQLDSVTAGEIKNRPCIGLLTNKEDYELTAKLTVSSEDSEETKEIIVDRQGTFDFFNYDDLFDDTDTTTKSVTLNCTTKSDALYFVNYTFDVVVKNPKYDPVTVTEDSKSTSSTTVYFAYDGSTVVIVNPTQPSTLTNTNSTTQTSNNGTIAFPAALVSSSDETTTTTTTKADNTTTKTDNSTTKADNSTTTTTKAGASKSLPVSNSDVIVGASVANGTSFVDGSGNAVGATVKITSTALDSTTLANLRAGLATYGVKSDNSVGYDISLKANGYSTVKIKEKSGSVTVTLAYPSETVKANRASYTFTVYHQVSSSYVLPLKGTATDSGVQFTTDSFSPFLLAWTVTGTTTDDGKSPKTGEDDLLLNLSLMMAILSVISLATILLKKKYTTAQETVGYESYQGYTNNRRYSGNQYYPRNPRRRR